MKFQFFIKSLTDFDGLQKVYSACKNNKIEEVVCTSGLLADIVDEAPRNKIIAVIDYPFGNSSFAARRADIFYCIEMGIRQIEVPINPDFILTGDLHCFGEEFNALYEEAALEKCIIKPMVDYRLLSASNHDFVGDLIYFLKEEICIDSVTINSGQLSDYFPENFEICRRFDTDKIKVTTCRELHAPDHQTILAKHAYKIRLSNISSLNMIK